MRLFHGTTKEVLLSIRTNGIKCSDHGEWGMTVCAVDSLNKAKKIAAYFGHNGIVIEFEKPASQLMFHPDYGSSPEFDTIHVMSNVAPNEVVNVIDAPSNLANPRPANVPLRQWKSEQQAIDSGFTARLDKLLDGL